ncbi:MAG: ABC transporter ATP-binding protein/permease [Defluviitaleaceae bacterium]|nr:ABC transporter ATP-binding protein/permease [Defluviitaleaceae bacterium]
MKQFAFEYDLGLDMSQTAGKLIFSQDGMITAEENGEVSFHIDAKDVKEALVMAGVGCGLIYVKYEDAPDKVLCRFTMGGLKLAGEFCKLINFYKLTGEAYIPDEVEARVCEKCGKPMMAELSVCVFCYSKLTVVKRAFGFFKPYAKTITASQLTAVLANVAFLVFPLFTRVLIDRYLEPQTGTWSNILLIIAAMVAVRVLGDAIFVISTRVYNKATIAIGNDIRSTAYSKVQSHSMTLFAKRTPGDLIRRVMDDTGTVSEFINDISRWMVDMVLMFVIAVVILFITNWQLALLVLLPVPFVMLLLSSFNKFIRARFEREWRRSSKVNSILHDIIKGIRTVKSFGNEKREIEKFSAATRDLATISSKNEALWGVLFQPITFLMGTGEFLVLFVGGWMVLNDTLTIGELVQFNMYMWAIYGQLRWMVNMPRWMANATTSMVKVFELFDDESEITSPNNPDNVPIAGAVDFDNVYFGYKSYEPVLKGVNLEIKPGEMIGLVGKSGVGKSTLINLAMRLYDPNNGKVAINGVNLKDMDTKHLHENMGVVFQDSFLFAGTFLENIAYGKAGATVEEVVAAAKAAEAHDFIMKTPDGYNTSIGEGGQSLSGGERQRLSIARAIIKNPEILILDEATSSLDVETESLIQESLNRITKGRTTIAIAHRLSTLRNADRLVVLKDGGVAEVGTHAELLKQKGIYYDLVMAQRQNSRKAEAEV